MKLYPEMFISKWHFIALGMIGIAWIALWLGGYDRKTILKSGVGATIMLYIIASLPIALIVHDRETVKENMISRLDQHHTARMESQYGGGQNDMNQLAAVASSRRDDDGYVTYIFAGNYSESFSFSGSLNVSIYDEQGELLHEESYEKIALKPGEKVKIDQFYSQQNADRYQYKFIYHK